MTEAEIVTIMARVDTSTRQGKTLIKRGRHLIKRYNIATEAEKLVFLLKARRAIQP